MEESLVTEHVLEQLHKLRKWFGSQRVFYLVFHLVFLFMLFTILSLNLISFYDFIVKFNTIIARFYYLDNKLPNTGNFFLSCSSFIQ